MTLQIPFLMKVSSNILYYIQKFDRFMINVWTRRWCLFLILWPFLFIFIEECLHLCQPSVCSKFITKIEFISLLLPLWQKNLWQIISWKWDKCKIIWYQYLSLSPSQCVLASKFHYEDNDQLNDVYLESTLMSQINVK